MIDNILHNKHLSLLALFLLSCLCLIFFLVTLWGFYHDDAYIVLRYAKNFLEGNGLVWNAGERVEGYSCFLWIMLISFLGYFNIDLFLASKVLGIFFAFSTLILFFIFEKQNKVIGALLLSTNSCFALWAVGGLETVAFGFFVFLGCYLFQENYRKRETLFAIGFIFSLATMTRPEGLLFFTITFVFCLLKELKLTNANFKAALWLAAGFLASYLPYFLWRFYYYGYLFPCPFYVKGGTNILKILFGVRYIFHFLISYGFPVAVMLLIADWKSFIRQRFYVIFSLLLYCLYVLVIGGDHMPGFRFMVPILPLFYLFIQESLAETRFKSRLMVTSLSIIILGINLFVSYGSIPRGPVETIEAQSHSYKYRTCSPVPDEAAHTGKLVGLYIKAHWPAHATVAGNAAGAIPYYSDMAFIDMLGLTNYNIAKREIIYDYNFFIKDLLNIKKIFSAQGRSEIKQKIFNNYLTWQLIPGHGKGDGQYVLSRKPDYIIIGPTEGDTKPWFLGDKEILDNQDFHENYQLKQATINLFSDPLHYFYYPTKTGLLSFKYYERSK